VQVPHLSADELCHYVDVRDVARLQITLAEHPAAVGQIFLCAGPKPVTGFEFLEIIRRLVPGIQADFGFPWSMAQGGQIAFDMSKTKKLLNFEPKYSLEDSIASIMEWVHTGGLKSGQAVTDQKNGPGVKKD
jgi:nucleoside-diphosphate-sugar epimerase